MGGGVKEGCSVVGNARAEGIEVQLMSSLSVVVVEVKNL